VENIIAVMVDRFRSRRGKRSVASIRNTLDNEPFDDFWEKEFNTRDERDDYILLNILSSAYQDGISAGKKLSDKNQMNEIDAVEFCIKQLKQVKDGFKASIAKKLV